MAAHVRSNGQAIIFCRCGFFFFLFFLAYSQQSQISAVTDWMTIIHPHMMWPKWPQCKLECRSEMCCTRLAENTGCKKFAICAPSHNFVGLYLCNEGMQRQSEKKLVKEQYLLHMSSHCGKLGQLAAEICWRVWGTPANFNGLRVLALLLQRRRSTEAN